jgi:hypothetical protein
MLQRSFFVMYQSNNTTKVLKKQYKNNKMRLVIDYENTLLVLRLDPLSCLDACTALSCIGT